MSGCLNARLVRLSTINMTYLSMWYPMSTHTTHKPNILNKFQAVLKYIW